MEGIRRYDRATETTVYFCVLEALQNVSQHAEASTALVRLEQLNGSLLFDVVDDGVGFDHSGTEPQGTGLTNMIDRVEALGGSLRFESSPGDETRVSGQLPALVHAEAST